MIELYFDNFRGGGVGCAPLNPPLILETKSEVQHMYKQINTKTGKDYKRMHMQ